MADEQAKKYLEAQAVWLRSKTKRDITEALLNVGLDWAATIDKYSTSILVLTGACFPILLSNSKEIAALSGHGAFVNGIKGLIVSALFGALAKERVSRITLLRQMFVAINDSLNRVFAAHDPEEERIAKEAQDLGVEGISVDAPSLGEIEAELLAVAAWWQRRRIRKAVAASAAANDPLAPLKAAAQLTHVQILATILQAATFLLAILIFVLPAA